MRVKIVGYCPFCGSPRTGYMIGGFPKKETIVNKFQKGERINFYSFRDNRRLNCFCSACEGRWHKELKKTYLDNEDFNNYLHEFEFYEERNELKKAKDIPDKPDMTQEEKGKRFKRNTTILAYTTGIDLRKLNPYNKK